MRVESEFYNFIRKCGFKKLLRQVHQLYLDISFNPKICPCDKGMLFH